MRRNGDAGKASSEDENLSRRTAQGVEPEEQPSRKRRNRGGIGAILAAIIAFALKFKALFAFAKIFASSWSLILTLWLYALAFGWRFGLVLVLLILAHELGHYAAFRAYGLPVRLPVFIPFLGAFTAGAVPQDPEHAAYIALAGPFVGLGLAGACYAIGVSGNSFWLACASVGAFLNLFNMIPISPFDGGRVIASARAATHGAKFSIYAWYFVVAGGLALVVWQTSVSLRSYAAGTPY